MTNNSRYSHVNHYEQKVQLQTWFVVLFHTLRIINIDSNVNLLPPPAIVTKSLYVNIMFAVKFT